MVPQAIRFPGTNAETVKVMDEASTDGSFTIAQTNGQNRRDTRQECRQEKGAVGADKRHCKRRDARISRGTAGAWRINVIRVWRFARTVGGASFGVLGSQSDREGAIVSSRVQINGGAPIRIDWRLNSTNHGYKITDVIVNGISTAGTQHADLVSVMQRNSGYVEPLLIAMREKNVSNGVNR